MDQSGTTLLEREVTDTPVVETKLKKPRFCQSLMYGRSRRLLLDTSRIGEFRRSKTSVHLKLSR